MSQFPSAPTLTPPQIATFRRQVRSFYRLQGRHDLPWRRPEATGSFDPYKILVSEAMLQQTQVGRVVPKFKSFLERFPTVEALAEAPLGDVLRAWNGLGYNRRARFLHQAAQHIVYEYNRHFPADTAELLKLPGVGPNTAGAIQAYAFNRRALFVETNIRTVYIHHFFGDQTAIGDQEILAILSMTIPRTDPRSWYWALMDYGTSLKQSVGNLNRASRSYTKQSAFAGSSRQLRGRVIRLLGQRAYPLQELELLIGDERLPGILQELQREGLIKVTQGRAYL